LPKNTHNNTLPSRKTWNIFMLLCSVLKSGYCADFWKNHAKNTVI